MTLDHRYQPATPGRERVMLYLLRHAQAGTEQVWQQDAAVVKQFGLPLTSIGRQQAAATAAYLADWRFDYIYTSDLLRAVQTAEAIKSEHTQALFQDLRGLREVHADHSLSDDSGEQAIYDEEMERVHAFAAFMHSFNNNEQILIVSHGNFINQLLRELAGCPANRQLHFSLANAALSCALIDETGQFRITAINHSAWLDERLLTMT